MKKHIYTDDLTGIDIDDDSGFEVRFLGDKETLLHAQSQASIIEQLLIGPFAGENRQELVNRGILIITQAEVEALMEGMVPPGIEVGRQLVLGSDIPEDAGPPDEVLGGDGCPDPCWCGATDENRCI